MARSSYPIRLACAFLLSSTLPLICAVDVTVDLDYSTYIGTAQGGGTGVTEWLGIRYAAPPLGSLRFVPPQDPLVVETPQPANQVRFCILDLPFPTSNLTCENLGSMANTASQLTLLRTTPLHPRIVCFLTCMRPQMQRRIPNCQSSFSSKAGAST